MAESISRILPPSVPSRNPVIERRERDGKRREKARQQEPQANGAKSPPEPGRNDRTAPDEQEPDKGRCLDISA